MLVKLKNFILNFKNLFFQNLTNNQLAIVKKTKLLDSLPEVDVLKILNSSRVIRYARGQTIFKTGKKIKKVYIILSGIVNVVNSQTLSHKMIVNQLHAGNYITPNTRVGHLINWHNVSAEAKTQTLVLILDERFKHTQGYRSDIETIISRLNKPKLIQYNDGEQIFKVGDVSLKAYIILSGKVKLSIPNKQSNITSEMSLNEGCLFGELGILRNSNRAATATTIGKASLLEIDKDEFKSLVTEYDDLKLILHSLQELYRIPLKDKVELCLSDNHDTGKVITSIYSLSDGRLVIATKTLNMKLFTMTVSNESSDSEYKFAKGNSSIHVGVKNGYIVSIVAIGVWEVLPQLCTDLLEKKKHDLDALKLFNTQESR